MAGGHLPVEVLDKVMGYLGVDDVMSCSGVNARWCDTASRRLALKFGIQLYRGSAKISPKARDVFLTGLQEFPNRKLRRLQTLRLWYDRPSTDQSVILDNIFNSCKNLSRLELLNLDSIITTEVEVILDRCSPGLKLRLRLRDLRRSKEAMGVLVDHRELFEEIIVEHGQDCQGWFPVPAKTSKFVIPESTKSIRLNCLGLKHIGCFVFDNLRTLKLRKCFALSDTSLKTISRLGITKFAIAGSSVSESTWLHCLELGFQNLQHVSITGSKNLTPAIIKALCAKNLSKIKLEITKLVEGSGVPHIYKLSNLTSLHIITDQIVSNCVHVGIDSYWMDLRRLRVEESLFSYDETLQKVGSLERLCRLKKIEFSYQNNPSKITETPNFKSGFQNIEHWT